MSIEMSERNIEHAITHKQYAIDPQFFNFILPQLL